MIRKACLSDSTDIARLTGELGYASETSLITEWLGRIASQQDQVVYVAVFDDRVVGWLQAQASICLESGYRVEIVGLIVDPSCRRRGAGRALIEQTERWAEERGAGKVVVRTNTQRVESHEFYRAQGFTVTKTQTVYTKLLEKTPVPSEPKDKQN